MRLMNMNTLLILGGAALGLTGTLSGRAQCLPLADMTAIAADRTALVKPQALAQLSASSWVFRGTPPRSKEIQWTSAAASASADGVVVPAIFMLRPFLQSFDVVLKTTEASCVRQLRSELKDQKLTPVPVTCPGCEAARFDGPDYQATIYSKMKGDYPFVVVVHPLSATPVQPPKAGSATTTP